jgi:hypothetical protein
LKIKDINGILLVITFLIVVGCNSLRYDQEVLTGHWNLHQVYQKDLDVSQEHNPEMDRYIIFYQDGTFESGGNPYGKNTGSYEFDRSNQTLYLDSDAGEDDDSRWKVEIAGDTMVWQGIGSTYAESFKLVHLRDKF